MRLDAYGFIGLSEGAYDCSETQGLAGTTVYGLGRYFPRTRALVRTDPATPRRLGMDGLSPDGHAACDFNCVSSNRAPFFQTANVIAAILCANVRRAILGFIDLASSPA